MKKAIFAAGAVCMMSALVATSAAIVNNVREGSNPLDGPLNWRTFSSRDAHPMRDFQEYHLVLPERYAVVPKFDSTEHVKMLPRVVKTEDSVDPYLEYRREYLAEVHRSERIAQGWWRLFE